MTKNNCCPQDCCPKPGKPVDSVVIQRLWDKIKATFADRRDVLELALQLRRLEEAKNGQVTIQSGKNGQLVQPDESGVVRLEYENWVQKAYVDSNGNISDVYNDSPNALSTAAAASIVKAIRRDMSEQRRLIRVVIDVDKEGRPVVPESELDFNCIYLTPKDMKVDGSGWNEWVALPAPKGCSPYRHPYSWERLGDRQLDLKWVQNDIARLNKSLNDLCEKLNKYSESVAKAIIDNAVKPLQDLKEYIESPDFIKYVVEQMPRASLGEDGLMTSGSYALLASLATWAANDHKVVGGGALSIDYVIKLLEQQDVPTEDLKKTYNEINDIKPNI